MFLSSKKGIANLGINVRLSKRTRLEANQRNGIFLWSSPKLDHTQAEDKITSLKIIAKGDLLHGVSAISVKSILQTTGKCIVKRFRLARVADRFVKEPENKGPT